MERIRTRSAIGINTTALRNWGALFLIVGIIGKCILQDRLAGLNHQDLLAVMEGPTWMLLCAILGILMQLLEACAIPIFAYLLVEGFRRTGDLKKYILRLLAAAILSELPYNLAYGGRLLDISSRNPVFAMVLGLVLLHFYSAYPEKNTKSRVMKVLLTVATLIWAFMLGIQYGVPIIAIVAVLWGCREKKRVRAAAGAGVAILCSFYSLYMIAAPMGFLAVHLCNEEPAEYNRRAYYLSYPIFLTVAGVLGLFL